MSQSFRHGATERWALIELLRISSMTMVDRDVGGYCLAFLFVSLHQYIAKRVWKCTREKWRKHFKCKGEWVWGSYLREWWYAKWCRNSLSFSLSFQERREAVCHMSGDCGDQADQEWKKIWIITWELIDFTHPHGFFFLLSPPLSHSLPTHSSFHSLYFSPLSLSLCLSPFPSPSASPYLGISHPLPLPEVLWLSWIFSRGLIFNVSTSNKQVHGYVCTMRSSRAWWVWLPLYARIFLPQILPLVTVWEYLTPRK